MTIRRYKVTLTTDGSGDAAGDTPTIYGKLVSLRYVKTDFADGATYTMTGKTSATPIWTEVAVNASATRYPRAATCTTAGVASLYAAGGTAVQEKIAISGEPIHIVVAGGGDTKSGAFHITIDG